MTSIGDTLRRERLKHDLSLERISKELKVSQRLLEAIESDDFSKLPGDVFARSWVRQYARLVGLDEEEMGRAVRQLLEPPPSPGYAPRLVESAAPARPSAKPIELPRLEEWQMVGADRGRWFSSLRSLVLVFLAMVICSGVYTWWQRQRRQASQPAHETAQIVAPRAPTRAYAASKAAETTVAPHADPSDGNAAPQVVNAVLRSTDVVGDHGAVRVDLTAEESVWILVRSDGKYMFSGTLSPNQSRTVEAASSVFLQVGNAGGVSIALNGKPIGSVGSRGEVRNLQLTSGGFQIVAARSSVAPLDPL
jgi:cytoskeletal protein RodZ